MARTPSAEAHAKVIKAALDLIAERGVESTSMDAIAAASGVSKATVYKHWANKDALLIEILRTVGGELPDFNSGSPRADLLDLLRYLTVTRTPRELSRIWMHVIGYAKSNPDFHEALREYSFAPRRKQIARMLRQAAKAGDLRRDIDIDLAMDLLIGPIIHRRFVNEKNLPPDLPERVVDCFWDWAKAR